MWEQFVIITNSAGFSAIWDDLYYLLLQDWAFQTGKRSDLSFSNIVLKFARAPLIL